LSKKADRLSNTIYCKEKYLMKKPLFFLLAAVLAIAAAGCTKHKIETRSEVQLAPVEVKPIHITIDINIKVDRALDDFFGDLDQRAEELK
jgi:hypothetical protein